MAIASRRGVEGEAQRQRGRCPVAAVGCRPVELAGAQEPLSAVPREAPLAPGPGQHERFAMDFVIAVACSLDRLQPTRQTLPVHDRERIGVTCPAEPAHPVAFRLAEGLLLHRERQHRSGAALGRGRQARTGEQDLLGGEHELHARGAPRQLGKAPLSANRRPARVDQRPLAAHRCIGERTADAQQAHRYFLQTTEGHPKPGRVSSAAPRAWASPIFTRRVAMK